MFHKILSGYCNKVKHIDTFATLRAIMNPPTPENHQRLVLSVQQLIQSQQVNWKMVHRLQQLKDQYNIQLDMPHLLAQLKEQPIDPTKQRFAVDLMEQYFTVDEEFFTEIYYQILRMQDLLFPTLQKLLNIYFKYSEFLDENKVLPPLIQNMLAQDTLDTYDLVHAFSVLGYSSATLTPDNQQWLNDLKEEMIQQIINVIPSLGQKQFRLLIQTLRTGEYESEELKQALIQYFLTHKQIFGQTTLVEFLNLCNMRFYQNDDIKYQILIQLNLLKVRGVNESKMINKFILPNLPLQEQELMANLITLSGIQLDREFFINHNIDSNSKRRQKIEELEAQSDQIDQIVKEIITYTGGQFTYLMNVLNLAQSFGVHMPQLLTKIVEQLQIVLNRQMVDPTDLLQALNFLEECNIKSTINSKCVGMKYFRRYLVKEPFPQSKIHYLQRMLAKKCKEDVIQALELGLKNHWSLELLSRQILLYDHYKIPISEQLAEKYNDATLEFTQKYTSSFNQIQFYKLVEMANWSSRLKSSLMGYYHKGRAGVLQMKKAQTKNLEQASHFEGQILNHIKHYMPPDFKLMSNQMINGTEVDLIVQNKKGEKLFIQIHGKSHFYHDTDECNYQTTLENYKLSRLGNFRVVSHYDTENSWYNQKEKAVNALLSCLM